MKVNQAFTLARKTAIESGVPIFVVSDLHSEEEQPFEYGPKEAIFKLWPDGTIVCGFHANGKLITGSHYREGLKR
jgi:hypothetical protein